MSESGSRSSASVSADFRPPDVCDAALASCVDDLGALGVVRAVASVMRVEGEGDE